MKKYVLGLTALLALVAVTACDKKEQKPTTAPAATAPAPM